MPSPAGEPARRLIVNADDLGLYPSVNRGIVRAFRQGLVTRASLLVTGHGLDDALRLLREHADLPVGVHLALVEGRPLLPPERVATLVGLDGSFHPGYRPFVLRYLRGRVSLGEVRAEFEAQLECVADAGVAINHLDSHQHLHALPAIFELVIDLARRFNVPEVRYPCERPAVAGLAAWRALAGTGPLLPALKRACPLIQLLGDRWIPRHCPDLAFADHFRGFLSSGHLTTERLLAVLRALPAGTTELVCHPGEEEPALHQLYDWGYHWAEELAALTAPEVRAALLEEGIELVSSARSGA